MSSVFPSSPVLVMLNWLPLEELWGVCAPCARWYCRCCLYLASAAARKPALCESCSIPKCGLQFVTKPFNIAASFLKKLFQGCWVLAFQHLFHSCGFLLLSLVLFVWAMPLIVQNCSYGLFCHSVISSENSTNNILPQKVYIKTVIVFLVPLHIFLYLLSGICNHFVLVLPSLTSWINLVYYWQDKSCFVVFSAF